MPTPLPLRGLHHISRVTGRLPESITFYRDVLGFAEIPRPNFDFRGAWLSNYGLQIHLIHKDAAGEAGASINSRSNHIAFAAPDIEAVQRALDEHDIVYQVNFQAKNPNVKQLFFQDPDGHHIEVGQYPAVG